MISMLGKPRGSFIIQSCKLISRGNKTSTDGGSRSETALVKQPGRLKVKSDKDHQVFSEKI
jgi:hypothetical protein